jgi:hypothetical protein
MSLSRQLLTCVFLEYLLPQTSIDSHPYLLLGLLTPHASTVCFTAYCVVDVGSTRIGPQDSSRSSFIGTVSFIGTGIALCLERMLVRSNWLGLMPYTTLASV